MLSTLQRRDKISELTQAIASLKRADEIPVSVPGAGNVNAMAKSADAITSAVKLQLTDKPQSKMKTAPKPRKKKAKVRKQLYTHVKTKQGSVVHAVLGKDKIGEWRTPALCGATPPQRDRMGWEFPTHDDGVTCTKCYRKLPANGKRHLPKF